MSHRSANVPRREFLLAAGGAAVFRWPRINGRGSTSRRLAH